MSVQLPLDLEAPDAFSRDNFIVNPALQIVLDVLLAPETWLGHHLLILGPKGSGKTHIGHVFAEAHRARFLTAAQTHDLATAHLPSAAFVVDDADLASEEALFHLSNHVQISGQQLVLLTEKHPLLWDTQLPDLASRLRAMRLLTLSEPDDDLLAAILGKLFARRFIDPSQETLDYIARRMQRSVGAAQKIVTDLEHYANGRAFNRSLARDFFDQSISLDLDEPTQFDTF